MSNASEPLTIPKGDYGYREYFTCKDADGNARDMTGYTAKLKVWSPDDPDTLIVDEACEWSDQSGGVCYYVIQQGDFDTAGSYHYEIEVTKSGIKDSADSGSITVTESP